MNHKLVSEDQVQNLQDREPALTSKFYPSSYKQLFNFADSIDIILMVVASLFSIANGISIVFYSVPIGGLVDAFSTSNNSQQIVDAVLKVMIGFLINSAVVFFNCWIMTAVWTVTSQRQMVSARKQYFKAILLQEQAWHDKNRPIQLCQKMYSQISKVHQALVTNMTSLLTKISMGSAGIIIALATGWKMALVMIAFLPAMMLSGFIRGHYQKKRELYMQTTKLKNDSDVIEIFDNIKTVKMLNGQSYEYGRYDKRMEKEQQQLWRHGKNGAIAFSVFFFCIIMNYTLGFWYGSKLVSQKQYNSNTGKPYGISEVIIIFFTLYISNLNLSALPDNLTQFSISRYSMAKIMSVIKRKPKINFGDKDLPYNIKSVKFNKISFDFQKPVFKLLNLEIKPGMTAIIGTSGCGKSTLISLLMRFYDPKSGQIIINSQNKQKYNLQQFSQKSIRENIGYVGQEPVLIGKTIRQALLSNEKTDQQIYKVLQKLRSRQFAQKIGLDQPFMLLSGGQKQRIAIARAILRRPKILILDESTSALDRQTENMVLQALKNIGIQFIIMIAHRPETICQATHIIKIQDGRISFNGSYNQYSKTQKQQVKQDLNKGGEKNNNLKLEIVDQSKNVQLEIGSMINEKKEEQQQQHNQVEFKCNYIWRLIKMNAQYWYLYVFGILGAIYFGCIFPTFSYVLSKIILTLLKIDNASDQLIAQYQQYVNKLSLILLYICLGSLILTTIRWVFFQFLTCKLATKVKKSAFNESINKDYASIQLANPSSYSFIITKNCENLKNIAGNFMPTILQNALTLIIGLLIAFAYSWTMTLVAFGILPLVLLASKLMMAFNHGMQSNTQTKHRKNHQLVVQAVINIKTVRSCALQQRLLNKFSDQLDGVIKLSIKYGNLGGIMFGIGQTLIFCMIAVIFYIGALLIRSQLIDNEDMFISIIAIMFAGVQAGGNLYFLSQLAPAKYGAAKYFELMGQEQQILISEADGQAQHKAGDQKHFQGNIRLENISFKYPNRKDFIFTNFSLNIKSGEKIALVGQSGSGKTTLANLIFKLYQPASGKILIDGVQVKSIEREHISKILGIVMQQPVLFNRSVYENVCYNINACIQDIVKATKQSKAYDFIVEGKFGRQNQEGQDDSIARKQFGQNNQMYEYRKVSQQIIQKFMRCVGSRGSYLSGGQKQRIALARSLIRCPKILILDEATSALDTDNEKLVQETLQNMKNVTQIIIAHRLSTIKNCDRILVMRNGRIVQQGNYQALIKRNGYFAQMIQMQGYNQ